MRTREKNGKLTLLAALVAVCLASSASAAEPTRVLFIGNSLTYWNEMPWMVGHVARSLGDKKLQTAFSGFGGATLRQQWQRGRAAGTIRAEKWDYVVLQAQSGEMLANPDETRRYAHMFDEVIRKAGAKTIIFDTWVVEENKTPQSELTARYARLARELGATLAPVGTAWDELRSAGVHVFDESGVHPSLIGTYLTACVFYATIRRASPVGATFTFDEEYAIPEASRAALERGHIDEKTARRVQDAAWKAVKSGVRRP